jgi:hypothetical protein
MILSLRSGEGLGRCGTMGQGGTKESVVLMGHLFK